MSDHLFKKKIDGVINYDYGYVSNYKDFKLRPRVVKGLKLLQDSGYLIFDICSDKPTRDSKKKI